VTALNYTTKTRIEWFNAKGELLDTVEVPGDATAVLYDPERGAHMPLVPESPAGAVQAVSRLVFESATPQPRVEVEDQALARVLDMVEALKAKLLRIPETLGIDPIVVVWGDPASRSEEVWVGFDGARDDDAIVVVEKRSGAARKLPWSKS